MEKDEESWEDLAVQFLIPTSGDLAGHGAVHGVELSLVYLSISSPSGKRCQPSRQI